MKKILKEAEDLHKLAVQLCEGGLVWFEGHQIGTRTVHELFNPCQECEMDSICDMKMIDLCAECESYDKKKHYLYLANKKRR